MSEPGDRRPDPDALLRRVMADDRKRTRLKLFFGFAPGVGKTFAMLESARRLKAQGVDVVVGIIETHGRSETAALLEGLEVLARKPLEYRGRTLQEFDLEGALKRKPAVLLVDELAHTNVEGSRHARRWQDVLELLDAGIEVHTTLNVQHLESLNDVVAQITHVQVRETVPDEVLERADGIELVDLPPEELLKRLAEGKVYVPEQARQASEHFFRTGNLLALRELALRRTAERVDSEVQAYRKLHEIHATWPAGERILVCVGPAPASGRLVRAARRMAAGLRAPWHAVWVSNPMQPLGEEDQVRLEQHLELAESLGGEVVRLSGTEIAEELLSWARTHNVTRIVLGKPTHTWWRDRLRGSLLDSVVRGSGDIDVIALSGDEDDSVPRTPGGAHRSRAPWWHWVASLGVVALTSAAGLALRRAWDVPDPEMLFLLGIMFTAAAFGRGPAIFAAALSVAAYDFFFVPPSYTFAVSDTNYVLTFAMMFGIGVLISALAGRLRQQEQAARQREADTRALFTLTRDLAQASSVQALGTALCRHVVDAVLGAAVVLLPRDGKLAVVASLPSNTQLESNDLGVAQWAHEHDREAGLGTDTLSGARLVAMPLGKGTGVLGWLPGGKVDRSRRALLDAFVRQAGVAIDRFQFSEQAKTAALKARTEELRSSLLSTVSHDLRTPLAVVTGAAQTLRDDRELDSSTQAQLLDTICDEAERLERLVRNLLDMTRVQAGALSVKKEWVPVEELIGSARARLEKTLAGRSLTVHAAPEVPFLQVDPVLFEQVLFNLLDNAAKYTPAGSPLEVEVSKGAFGARVSVLDRGPGVRPEEAEKLFDKFFRGSQQQAPGAGLGLAICRGIVAAHGGLIHAEERPGGGAAFIIDLPLRGEPPTVPAESE